MHTNIQYAIECKGLGRVYRSRSLIGGRREVVGLADLEMQIPRGKVFGLLGPNGAGKTTAIRILSTLLTPSTGWARVLGYDVAKQANHVRRHIGLVLGGDRGLYGRLTGRQNLRYFGALNHLHPKEADYRIDLTLEQVGLSEWKETTVERYSRGLKQRLHIARGLLTDPQVIFMDEPTIGLDPMGAQELRQFVPELASRGKTILLTTHYMLEADMLCDTIALINHGRLVALGTPTEIKRSFSRISIIEVTVRQTRPELLADISNIDGVDRAETGVDGPFLRLSIHIKSGADLRQPVMEVIGYDNVERLGVRDPTLEEAYLSILR